MTSTIATERLVLCSRREANFEPVADFYTTNTLSWSVGDLMIREDAWRHIATIVGHWSSRRYGFFVVEGKASGALTDFAGVWFPEGWPERKLGLVIFAPHRGKASAAGAACAASDHAKGPLAWPTLLSIIHSINVCSQKVAARLDRALEKTMPFMGSQVEIHRHPAPSYPH